MHNVLDLKTPEMRGQYCLVSCLADRGSSVYTLKLGSQEDTEKFCFYLERLQISVRCLSTLSDTKEQRTEPKAELLVNPELCGNSRPTLKTQEVPGDATTEITDLILEIVHNSTCHIETSCSEISSRMLCTLVKDAVAKQTTISYLIFEDEEVRNDLLQAVSIIKRLKSRVERQRSLHHLSNVHVLEGVKLCEETKVISCSQPSWRAKETILAKYKAQELERLKTHASGVSNICFETIPQSVSTFEKRERARADVDELSVAEPYLTEAQSLEEIYREPGVYSNEQGHNVHSTLSTG